MTLKLYTTSGCHLCEQAEVLLNDLKAQGICQWQPVEISESDDLIERYGIRIPVVGREGRADELGWPFSLEQLRQWVN